MRPTRDDTMLEIATAVSKRSTCSRRQVGCVLVDNLGRVLSVGHNGVPRGFTHCTDSPCAGSSAASGQGLELCQAIHAEQNALMFCSDIQKIETCYVTAFPCIHCIKMLLNTSCMQIICSNMYAPEHVEAGMRLWMPHVFRPLTGYIFAPTMPTTFRRAWLRSGSISLAVEEWLKRSNDLL